MTGVVLVDCYRERLSPAEVVLFEKPESRPGNVCNGNSEAFPSSQNVVYPSGTMSGSMNHFYKLSSTTLDPCTMVKQAYEQARRTWLCTGCAFPKPDTKAVDVALQEEEPDDTPLNMISGTGVGIARRDFLFSFGEELVRQHLYLGQVFGPNESPLENWMTFVGRHRIIVRGSKHATMRRCSECGRSVYFAMGQLCLYPQPPLGVPIFDDGDGVLVVSEDLIRRITPNQWPKLACTKLRVLDVPKDGLVELRGM